MDLSSRYEIVNTIATGDFATVYRARDRELGREVAIKQIHPQFLSDQRQLAGYWQEAQLLASLQHPNVLTIYDIVRPRGWLILELMRGSLADMARAKPVDLDFLRLALADALSALQFLHENGVTHFDVKPSNLLVDWRNRVVLGDFGLARRVSNEEGSLLKGTTKYMAPELVSPQFGAVGPASDLYSLGFSAYELLCGPQFETLFPGLATFGRDKQIAWMMWHAAADRSLPEIGRVLEGVPEDLAGVIQKLVVKDQSRRYPSARDALRALRPDRLPPDQPPVQEDAEAAAARKAAAGRKRRFRYVAILAMAFSLVLSVAMLLPERPKPVGTGPPEPTRGVITNVYADEWKLALASAEDGRAQEVSLKRHDRIFINDKSSLLRDLRRDDRVVVKRIRDESGRWIIEVFAYRPEVHKGHIEALQADEGHFTLTIDEGDDQGKDLVISVPASVKILLNGSDQIAGQTRTLADLQLDDRVVVHHVGEQTGRVATELAARRVVDTEGVIRDVDARKGRLTVAVGEAGNPQLLVLPLAPGCEITINDRRFLNQKVLKPADLRPGDKATVAHDTEVVRVNAYRVLGEAGVIRRVQFAAGMLEVVRDDGSTPASYLIGPQTKITLAGEPAELSELRDGDVVDVTHDMPGAKTPEARTVTARRPPDPTRWAVLVGIQGYEDATLTPLAHPVADAKLLREVLIKRYAVPPNQALLLADESLVRLEQGIPLLLGRARPGDKVIVYFAAHAYRGDEGDVYLAPKSFDLKRAGTTGLPLQWLVDRLEACPATEKLLLLDCSHAGTGADLARQPSTAEMMRTLKGPPGRSPLRTVTTVASCQAGQRGLVDPGAGHGLFLRCLAEGYSGKADKNRDNRLESTELFEFLNSAMAAAGSEIEGKQSPELFLPDDRPPRLGEEAKKAIRRLAAMLRQDRIDPEVADPAYAAAEQLGGKEPEPRLFYGLLLLKAKERDRAVAHFEELKIEHAELLLPWQATAWAQFEKRSYKGGVSELAELIRKIPRPKKPADPYPGPSQRMFLWTGQLREFAAAAVPEAWRPSAQFLAGLDAAVAGHGPQAQQLYQQGRSRTRDTVLEFEKRMAGAETEALALKLKVERRQLAHYVTFPYDDAAGQILAALDQ